MSRDRAEVLAATVAASWGPIHVAASARGIVAVELMSTRDAFAEGLERRLGRPVRWLEANDGPADDERGVDAGDAAAAGHIRAATAAITAAARNGDAGTGISRGDDANALASLPLDIEDRPAWDRAVLDAVRTIPRGETRSYGEIARAIGRPGAARAVGGAVGRNPVGLLVPCHRVIAGDGTLGGYGGGWWGDHERLLDLKATLLAQEGIVLPRGRPRGTRGR
jgi:O-6-methylguanine DNA methyltransferase